jgi:short-subunit dehydrogenase
MNTAKNVAITGASSGIGAALAKAYAGPGIQLNITGRNSIRLDVIGDELRQLGATVRTDIVDVSDRAKMHNWITEIEQEGPIDLLIANAGIDGSSVEGDEIYYRLTETNYLGVLNTVLPALHHMKKRGAGQIAIVSSLAGFRGLPGAVAYAASKAAVRSLGEGLRGRHQIQGVKISVVCPGFVESRITASNKFPMPFIWPADKAANFIKKKLSQNKARIVFPWPLYAGVWLINMIPVAWSDWIVSRAPRKQK